MLNTPCHINVDAAARFNLTPWELSGTERLEPLLQVDLGLLDTEVGFLQRSYLFEFRDVHFLVRYLLEMTRTPFLDVNGTLDVKLLRTEVPGFCDPTTTTAKLFINPLQAPLNGKIRNVRCINSDLVLNLWNREESVQQATVVANSGTEASNTEILLSILKAGACTQELRKHWKPQQLRASWEEHLKYISHFAASGVWSKAAADDNKNEGANNLGGHSFSNM